ncbi:MAG: dihydrolipoyl dehydrogenase [Chlamydiae bacterium]|nr:dihydrolipoyl dehydrogenase [Chlamydiota bacterium]
MERKKFDIAVIGAGPGGYVAAIKAAQSGKAVCLIEKKDLGGTCLNVGCIPTKTLLANASIMHKMKMAEEFGISAKDISFDFAKMKVRKDSVVDKLRKSLGSLLQSNKIVIIQGIAEFISPKELKIKGKENYFIDADYIIIATGSEPLDIGAFPCDHKKILNSTSILELTHLPKSLAIIGGGYIGCEFASLYAAFGVKVTILEALPMIIANMGKMISDSLTFSLKKKGVEIVTDAMVEGIDKRENGVTIRLKNRDSLPSDLALVAIGRKIVSKDLGLEKAGVKVREKGEIPVDEKMQTNIPGIYAIGDVTGKFLLAHVASHQGIIAASHILGEESSMRYDAVPAVIFTDPEIATVGMSLEEAQKSGLELAVGKFPFQALGKAIAANETEGFVHIISDKKTGKILGAQAIGHEVSNLIAEIALAINNELTLECIADTIHAHPTLPEAWLEAALIANETPIHFPPKKRSL